MNGPLVTVLIDTYNYGKFVEEAVQSALAQDFPRDRFEIIVVDDGSTDDTNERLQKYGNDIRYLQKPNGGQASAFNFGFENAAGEIIVLLDADDVWLPNKLKVVCEALEKNPAVGMAYHKVHVWNGRDTTSPDPNFVEISGKVTETKSSLLKYPMSGTSCLAFRRDIVKQLMPIPPELRSQADAFLTALIIFVAPVVAVPEYLAKYRVHETNLFAMGDERNQHKRLKHRMEMRSLLQGEIESWLQTKGYDLKERGIRAYLKQWDKAQEADRFALTAPGRWRYARHLYEFPRIYGENMTARHRFYSYIRAAGALFLGYHHLHVLDDLRMSFKGATGKTDDAVGKN